jgi:hypothetical protein
MIREYLRGLAPLPPNLKRLIPDPSSLRIKTSGLKRNGCLVPPLEGGTMETAIFKVIARIGRHFTK